MLATHVELLRASGRKDEALLVARESMTAAGGLPEGHPLRADPEAAAGGAFCDSGQQTEGERLLKEALALRGSYLPVSHRLMRAVEVDLARCRQEPYATVVAAAGPYVDHWQMGYLIRPAKSAVH